MESLKDVTPGTILRDVHGTRRSPGVITRDTGDVPPVANLSVGGADEFPEGQERPEQDCRVRLIPLRNLRLSLSRLPAFLWHVLRFFITALLSFPFIVKQRILFVENHIFLQISLVATMDSTPSLTKNKDDH
jgi:hypothetical protein